MPLLILVVILLVVALAQIEGQVVFRPHFLYKHRQQEKAEKENKRRQEVLEQQQVQTQPDYNDPYYFYQYQQFPGNQYNYEYNRYQTQYQPRANRVRRSIDSMHPLKIFIRHIISARG